MKVVGWFKAVGSLVSALAIGLAVTGIVNLLHRFESIGWALASVLSAAGLSALVAFFITNPRRKTPAAAAPKDAPAEAKQDQKRSGTPA
jgi:uncharacterized membrane protein (UPF0136 family)